MRPVARSNGRMEAPPIHGAAGGLPARAPALWVGLLYDQGALDAAWDLVKDWSIEELQALRAEVPRLALKTPFRNRTVKEVALNALQISHKGLHNRQRVDSLRMDETHFLKPLFQTAHSGLTPADELLAAYEGRWEGEITPIFQEYTY